MFCDSNSWKGNSDSAVPATSSVTKWSKTPSFYKCWEQITVNLRSSKMKNFGYLAKSRRRIWLLFYFFFIIIWNNASQKFYAQKCLTIEASICLYPPCFFLYYNLTLTDQKKVFLNFYWNNKVLSENPFIHFNRYILAYLRSRLSDKVCRKNFGHHLSLCWRVCQPSLEKRWLKSLRIAVTEGYLYNNSHHENA